MKNIYFCCRTSHEVRGLKYKCVYMLYHVYRSHLTRGAWIEIKLSEAGLLMHCRRTSHEVRGLKSIQERNGTASGMSHLTRGAWIGIQEARGAYVLRLKMYLILMKQRKWGGYNYGYRNRQNKKRKPDNEVYN